MVKFDIQDPLQREYHYDYLVREQLKKYDLITPQLMLVKYSINGKYKGVALIEELFTAYTASRYKRRSDGISLKFNDNYYQESLYQHGSGFTGAYNYFINDFESQEIAPVSKKDYKKNYSSWIKATSLLIAYQNNEIDLKDAFDVNKLLQYFALSEIWGIWHTTLVHNIRFYFNPISSKLEPWWWDNRPGLGLDNHRFNIMESPFVRKVLSDKKIYVKFKKILNKLINDAINPEVYNEIKLAESMIIGHIKARKFTIDSIINRAKSIKDALKKSNNPNDIFIHSDNKTLHLPQPVRAVAILEDNKLYVKIANTLPLGVRLKELFVVLYDKNSFSKRKVNINIEDIFLKGRSHDVPLNWSKIFVGNYDDLVLPKIKVVGVSFVPYTNVEYNFSGKFVGSLKNLPSENNFKKIIEKYPFIKHRSKIITISDGVWGIEDFIKFPSGYKLIIDAGTTLKFHNNAGFIVNGGLEINGTYNNNVILTSSNLTWPGVVVLANGSDVKLNNVILKNTNADYTNKSWGSGLLIYEGDTMINNLTILDSTAEDAINLLNGVFVINGLNVKNSKSDAIDIDFANGIIENSNFENIGGDAIDTSGSQTFIKNSYFYNVKDKSVSSGEASYTIIDSIDVNKSTIGVASKDSSDVIIKKSIFNEIGEVAIFVYNKKNIFHGASANITSTSFNNVNNSIIVQDGSRAILDGNAVNTMEINIDDLYDHGYMKKK
jgi:hypothetical protein